MKTDTRKTGRKTLNVLVDGISKFSVVRCVSIGGEMFPFPLLLNRNRNMAAQMRFDLRQNDIKKLAITKTHFFGGIVYDRTCGCGEKCLSY